MQKIIGKSALAFILSLAFTVVASAQANTKGTFNTVKTIPSFNLVNWQGGNFNTLQAKLPGKPLVIVYFSPTCSHCLEFLEELTSHLKDFKQVQFLLASAYSVDEIKTFVVTRGIHKMSNFKVGQDAKYDLGRFYNLTDIPSIYVYGKDGKFKKAFFRAVAIGDLKKAVG